MFKAYLLIFRKSRVLFFFFFFLFALSLLFHKNLGQIIFPFPYKEVIDYEAKTNGIDPRLVAAVIYVESGFNPRAVSKKGACGLMQLLPDTAAWIAQQKGESFDKRLLFYPRSNLEIGIWYLNYLYRKFQGSTILVLAAYNAGWARVKEWLDQDVWQGEINDLHKIPFPETRRYVARILRVYHIYKYLYS